MKTNGYILTIIILVLVAGLAGYLLCDLNHDSVLLPAAPDREFIARDDSFKIVISGKEDSLELLKNKLSSYSKKPVQLNKLAPGDTLQRDIHTFQEIVRTQDTLRKIDARQLTFIRNELSERNDQFANLQSRYNKDIDRQKKTRVNIFLSGIGVGVGASILVAVLIL